MNMKELSSNVRSIFILIAISIGIIFILIAHGKAG